MPIVPMGNKIQGGYNATTTSRSRRFLQVKLNEGKAKHTISTKTKAKQNLRGETMSLVRGKRGGRGGVFVGEHVRGETGPRDCDVRT